MKLFDDAAPRSSSGGWDTSIMRPRATTLLAVASVLLLHAPSALAASSSLLSPHLVLHLSSSSSLARLVEPFSTPPLRLFHLPNEQPDDANEMTMNLPVDVCATRRHCGGCAASAAAQRRLLPNQTDAFLVAPPTHAGDAQADEVWNMADVFRCVAVWGKQPCQIWSSTIGLLFDSPSPSSSSPSDSSLLHILFPHWCSCSQCPNVTGPPAKLTIDTAVFNATTRILSVTASSPLSLPSLTPDLSTLFTADTLASFGSAPLPQAVWVSEQELRIHLNASLDSTLVQASMSRMARLSSQKDSKSAATPFQILSSGWRVRNFPDAVQAKLSSDLALYGISIVYPPLPPVKSSSSSSSTGSDCAADDTACLNGDDSGTEVSSSAFLSSTEDKVGLGVGIGAGLILIATLIACVWWGRHSASPHRRKFTASSRNLGLNGATEVTPGSPTSRSASMSGSSPRLDPMSAAFEHFPSPSSPRLSPGRSSSRHRSPSLQGLTGEEKEGEIVLHVIPEAEEEISRSTRRGSKIGPSAGAGLGRGGGVHPPHETADGLDLGEVILSPQTPDSCGDGEEGPHPHQGIPSPLLLGARAPSSFDLGALRETDDIDELKQQMAMLQRQIQERKQREQKDAERAHQVQREQMTEKQKKESKHESLSSDLSAAFEAAAHSGASSSSTAAIELQPIASARTAPSAYAETASDDSSSPVPASSVSSSDGALSRQTSIASPSMFALDPASSPSALVAMMDPPTRQPSLLNLDSQGAPSTPSDSSLASPSAPSSRQPSLAAPLSVGYDTPGQSRPMSLATTATLSSCSDESRRDSIVATGMISVKAPLHGGAPASSTEASPSRSPSSSPTPSESVALAPPRSPSHVDLGVGICGTTVGQSHSPSNDSLRPTLLHVGNAWEATTPLASPSANAAFRAPEDVLDGDAALPLMSPTSVQFDATDALFHSTDAGASNSTASDSANSTPAMSRATSVNNSASRPPLSPSLSLPTTGGGVSPWSPSSAAGSKKPRAGAPVRIHTRGPSSGNAAPTSARSPGSAGGKDSGLVQPKSARASESPSFGSLHSRVVGGSPSIRPTPLSPTTGASSSGAGERPKLVRAVTMTTGSDGVPRAAPAPKVALAAGSGGLSGAGKKASAGVTSSPESAGIVKKKAVATPESGAVKARRSASSADLTTPESPSARSKPAAAAAAAAESASPESAGGKNRKSGGGGASGGAAGKLGTMLSIWMALACCVLVLSSSSLTTVVEARRTITISFRDLYDLPANASGSAPLTTYPLRYVNLTNAASGSVTDVDIHLHSAHILRNLSSTSTARYGAFCDALPPVCAGVVPGATPPSYASALASFTTPYTTLQGSCRTNYAYSGSQLLQCARPGGLLEVRWLLRNTGALTWKTDDVTMVAASPADGWPPSTLKLESPTTPGMLGSFVGLIRGPVVTGVWNHSWTVQSSCVGGFGTYTAPVEYSCSNGIFCDGAERLVNGVCVPALRTACDDSHRCTLKTCDEANALCAYTITTAVDFSCSTYSSGCYSDPPVIPTCGSCASRSCGDNGCGGSCGGCPNQFSCNPTGTCTSVSNIPGTCYVDGSGPRAIPLVKPFETFLGLHNLTVDLTKGLAQAKLSCAPTTLGPQLVYSFTVPNNTEFSFFGADIRFSNGLGAFATMDTLLELRKGYCFDSTNITPVTVVTSGPNQNTWCNDDAAPPGGKGAGMILSLTPGNYWLFAAAYNNAALQASSGIGTLSVNFTGGYIPDCTGRQCGPDVYGGSCGTCPANAFCDDYLQCTVATSPQCTTQRCMNGTAVCGSDNCGGSGTCGPLNGLCPTGQLCIVSTGQCAAFPVCNHFAPVCATPCNATEFCSTDCTCRAFSSPLPDLVLSPAAAIRNTLTIANRSFDAYSCAISEQCVGGLGRRLLMKFDAAMTNQGRARLTLPNPKLRPDEFYYGKCHNHYHYIGFADYQLLLPGTQTIVARTQRAGSCLTSDFRSLSLNSPDIPCRVNTTCESPGLDRGWTNTMVANQDCQWVDITGVPSGNYTLRVEINAQRRVLEESYDNNVQQLTVFVP